MLRCDEIIKGRLYQRARFEDKPIAAKLAMLEHYNITRIVNVWRKPDTDLKKEMGIDYSHHPLQDGILSYENLYRFRELARAISRGLSFGEVYLVHCQGGKNRSGLLNALVLMEFQGISGPEAYKIVKAARPCSFSNKFFVEYLVNGKIITSGNWRREHESPF